MTFLQIFVMVGWILPPIFMVGMVICTYFSKKYNMDSTTDAIVASSMLLITSLVPIFGILVTSWVYVDFENEIKSGLKLIPQNFLLVLGLLLVTSTVFFI